MISIYFPRRWKMSDAAFFLYSRGWITLAEYHAGSVGAGIFVEQPRKVWHLLPLPLGGYK